MGDYEDLQTFNDLLAQYFPPQQLAAGPNFLPYADPSDYPPFPTAARFDPASMVPSAPMGGVTQAIQNPDPINWAPPVSTAPPTTGATGEMMFDPNIRLDTSNFEDRGDSMHPANTTAWWLPDWRQTIPALMGRASRVDLGAGGLNPVYDPAMPSGSWRQPPPPHYPSPDDPWARWGPLGGYG